ncbi:hypothetical protein PAPYR_11440 [Paratrimastix pyriformis]|uniref:Uncharacterized protein n=1 Tax=Paratrimastix pyriformis TaxID=342808 RepID=A0ABQ8U3R7_9EUKA|nr:hypothetical protein PAPYR_11440 [Paratrimastix pyriformis]
MASWVKRVEEVVPGYLMVIHMEEGKRRFAVLNMYYPAYEPDGVKGKGVLMSSVESALTETVREARGNGEMVILLTDGNDWAKRNREQSESGLVDVVMLGGHGSEVTWRRTTKTKGIQENRIDLCMTSEEVFARHFGKAQQQGSEQ